MVRRRGIGIVLVVVALSAGALGTLAQPGQHGGAEGVTAQDAWNVELVGQIGGTAEAVTVQGEHVYLGVGPYVVILDASNPAVLLNKCIRSKFPLPYEGNRYQLLELSGYLLGKHCT